LRVFISYSRKDEAFARRLAASLEERAFMADWDQASMDPDDLTAGIAAEDEWWTRLQDMITAADVMVFVVSPDSARSKVCDEEIAHARALGKRIIAILHRPIDFRRAPPRLSALNVKISFVGDVARYDDALNELASALAVDVGWVRESTRRTQAAERWNGSDRERGLLLQGSDLLAAEKWLARRPTHAPPIPPLVLEFIDASRDAEEERHAIDEVQRVRYQELDRVTRPLLEEELKVREARPLADHYGVRDEQTLELDLIRSLLGIQTRWHPKPCHHIGSTGASHGYAEYFEFPCCGKKINDFLAASSGDPPSQFRSDGCAEIPKSIRYESTKQMNRFESALVAEFQGFVPERRRRSFARIRDRFAR
jgi:hypothetical protein